ncbi:hypothetical protein BJV78DRAFT_1158643 [Lactifluus subvellereus]|nr:hypothetical protein BJV78DRAFT_1158643 [Lactifluus subvellereus]
MAEFLHLPNGPLPWLREVVLSHGYLNHLQQTHKPECRAILARSHGDLSEDSDPDSEAGDHLDAPQEALAGGGGLGVENDKEQGSGDSEDEDEMDEDEDLMYGGDDYQEWEALIPEQPGRQGEMGIDEPEDDRQGGDELYGAQEARWAAEEAFRKTQSLSHFHPLKLGPPLRIFTLFQNMNPTRKA